MAALRKQAGKTQAAVAEATGIDRSVIIALEKGRRAITTTYAERIAPVLGVSPAELLPPVVSDERDPDDPLVRLARLEETTARAEDLARAVTPLREAIEFLANGDTQAALRVLSETAGP